MINSALASLAIEGLVPEEFAIEIALKRLRGELTKEEATILIIKGAEKDDNR